MDDTGTAAPQHETPEQLDTTEQLDGATRHHDRLGLVTGATGYVGHQVVQRLLDDGWRVRVLVRHADRLPDEWLDRLDVVEGDASDAEAVNQAMQGVDVVWFLIHSMGDSADFVERDRTIAQVFATAAKDAGVQRIVYLGGLHPDADADRPLSDHLASRVEVGQIFIDSGVPTAAIQAGVLLGQGSASFDMLRALSERLPAAGGPGWLRNEIQPIHIDHAVHYLVSAADLDADQNRTFDVGGTDALSYADMMKRYARVRGLGPRPIVTAPITTPTLAAHWIGLVTPIDAAMARPLIESMLHDTVVKERDLDALVGPPPGGAIDFDEAVRRASEGLDRWSWARTLAATGAVVALTAVAGTVATTPGARWYRRLSKPSWQPPGAVFGPVWSVLYADIAAVAALHLADAREKSAASDDDSPLGLDADAQRFVAALAINLALNASWSWVFFRRHNLTASTMVAAALAASSADLVRRVGAGRTERGVVLAPYAAWTLFAAALTESIRRRND